MIGCLFFMRWNKLEGVCQFTNPQKSKSPSQQDCKNTDGVFFHISIIPFLGWLSTCKTWGAA